MMGYENTKWDNEQRANREKGIVAEVNNLMNFSHTIAQRVSQSLNLSVDVEKAYLFDIERNSWPLVSVHKGCFEHSLGVLCDGRIANLRRTIYANDVGPYCYLCDTKFDNKKVINSSKIIIDYGINFSDFYKNLIILAKKFNAPKDEISEWEMHYGLTMALVEGFVSEF